MKSLNLLIFLVVVTIYGCKGRYTPPVLVTAFENTPAPPDYSRESAWAALPDKADNADKVPSSSGMKDMQQDAIADVFFIHPTSYLRNTTLSTGWNADVNDNEVNLKTDEGSILYQASAFNGAGKIYAPRYRQAFIYSYYTPEKDKSVRAFDTAYTDVKNAFEYYLANYNQGRPIIIASHSQGTSHAIKLLRDYFDNDNQLSEKLIAAYIIGMDVYDTLYTTLKPCRDPFDSRCYLTWRTFAKDYYPPNYERPVREAVCTNPLTWKTDSVYAGNELNSGGILRNFNKVIPQLSDAQVKDGVLRINKPNFPGTMFFNFKNYHIVDYNLFYFNIRNNARDRVRMFKDARPGQTTR